MILIPLFATRAPLRQGEEARLHVTHAERTLTLGPDFPVVLIGRDRDNQIVIAHRTPRVCTGASSGVATSSSTSTSAPTART